MTTDAVALTERMPDNWSLLAALMSAGPDTVLTTRADGAVIQLSDADGRLLAAVETPTLMRVPGEAARLLGVEVGGPVWWTEVRAATATRQAEPLAGTIATRLTAQLGGTVWPHGSAVPDGGSQVVPGAVGLRAPAAEQPAVDVLTDRAVVVIQDRPLVAMTAWLADALRVALADGRAFQLVTPPGSRLTMPTRAALTGQPHRWVVRDATGGCYDGLSGAELRWQDGAFAPTGRPAPEFVPAERPGGHQLLLTFRTRRPATAALRLGGPLEAVWRRLTGGPPAGWGSAEPAGEPWSRGALTEFARGRAPAPTWLVAVGGAGRPALATLRVSRTAAGVEEEVTAAFGGSAAAGQAGPAGGAGAAVPNVPSHDALAELAGELVTDHALVSLLVQQRTARADLTVPPWLEGAPEPVAFALGSADVRDIGPDVARRPPLPDRPRRLGPSHTPGFYYPITATGTGPAWQALKELVAHLRGMSGTGGTGGAAPV